MRDHKTEGKKVKIEKLNKEQIAQIEVFRDEGLLHGLSVEPTEHLFESRAVKSRELVSIGGSIEN